jgi:hypothetical protein
VRVGLRGGVLPRRREPNYAARVGLLGIYLNDHLAGATAALELARRTQARNQGNEVGRALEPFLANLAEDRDALRSIMTVLGVAENPAKRAAGWLAEKAGRLKLNGRLVGYSPLSRVEELEALCLGVEGKLSLWRTLKLAAEAEQRLTGMDLDRLVRRAQRQLADLERLRVLAAAEAFGGTPPQRKPRQPAAPKRKAAPRKPAARKTTRTPRKTTRTPRAPRQPRRSPTSP